MGYSQSKDQSQEYTSKSSTNACSRLYPTRADEFSTQTHTNTVQIRRKSENRDLFGNIVPYFHMLRHNASTTKECPPKTKECKLASELCACDYCNKVDIHRTSNSRDCFGKTTPSEHRSSQSIIEGSGRLYPNLAEENPTYDVPNTVDFCSRPSIKGYVGNIPYHDVLRPISTERLYPDLTDEFSKTYNGYDKVHFRGDPIFEGRWEKENFHEQRYNQPDPWAPPAYTLSPPCHRHSWAPPAYSVTPAPAAPPAYSVEPALSIPPASTPPGAASEPPVYLAPPTSSMSLQPLTPSAYLPSPTSSVSSALRTPQAHIKKTPKNRNKNKVRVASSTPFVPTASTATPTHKTPDAYSTTPSEAPRVPTAIAKTPENKNKKAWVSQPGSSAPSTLKAPMASSKTPSDSNRAPAVFANTPENKNKKAWVSQPAFSATSTPKAPVTYSKTQTSSEAFTAPTVFTEKNLNRNKNKVWASSIYSATPAFSDAHTALAEKAPRNINNDKVWRSSYSTPQTPNTPVAYSTTRPCKPADAPSPNPLPANPENPSKKRNKNRNKCKF